MHYLANLITTLGHSLFLIDGLVNEQYQVTTGLCTVQVLLHCTRSGFSPAVKGRKSAYLYSNTRKFDLFYCMIASDRTRTVWLTRDNQVDHLPNNQPFAFTFFIAEEQDVSWEEMWICRIDVIEDIVCFTIGISTLITIIA